MQSRGLREFQRGVNFAVGWDPISHLRKGSAEVPLRIPQALGRAKWQLFPEADGSSITAGKGRGMVRHDTLILYDLGVRVIRGEKGAGRRWCPPMPPFRADPGLETAPQGSGHFSGRQKAAQLPWLPPSACCSTSQQKI